MAHWKVIGAGFSGLVAAYELARRGHQVEVYEKINRVGGLISTYHHPMGLVETAANGVLNNYSFEELCDELNVPLVKTQVHSKKRYIFRNNKAQRWSLGFKSTLNMLWGFSKIKAPVENESVAEWGRKNFDQEAVDYLLSPALQGIYAGDVDQMSSTLIMGRFFNRIRRRAPQIRGSVSPVQGMGQLMETLRTKLIEKNVKFYLGHSVPPLSYLQNTIIATSAIEAAELLSNVDPSASTLLKKVEMLPLVRATLFFKKDRKIKGFGCLFAKSERMNGLGVLFDDSIFEREIKTTTESWILGGVNNKKICELTDDQIIQQILEDRARLLRLPKEIEQPESFVITRWPTALPHYTVGLEKILKQISPSTRKHLVGNYLGRIGLSQILEQTKETMQGWA